jgi:hypothetical protein
MATDPFPTLDAFLAHGLCQLDKCGICLEGFDSTHIAVRFCGPGSCDHVFGESCIKAWVKSDGKNANKCPMCRKVLFENSRILNEDSGVEEDEDEELQSELERHGRISGVDLLGFEDHPSTEGDEQEEPSRGLRLQDIRTREEALHFVTMLHNCIENPPYDNRSASQLYGDELLMFCTREALRRCEIHGSLPLEQPLWDLIGEVVEVLSLRYLCPPASDGCALETEEELAIWFDALKETLEWEFDDE